jgi:ABC-2 type transport system permease protein
MRGVGTLAWVELKLFVREPLGAFFTVIFPVILLLIFGAVFGNHASGAAGDVGFVDASTPGYVALVIATSGLLSLGINVARYREQGILRRLRATPLRPSAVFVAQIAALFVVTTIGVGMLLATGKALFGLHCAGTPGPLAAAFVLSCATMFALGMALASVVASARAAQAVGMAVFYPMIFLSGAAIPRELLPEGIQRAAVVLPLTHVVTLLQGAWSGHSWTAQPWTIAALGLTTTMASAAAVRSFRWE